MNTNRNTTNATTRSTTRILMALLCLGSLLPFVYLQRALLVPSSSDVVVRRNVVDVHVVDVVDDGGGGGRNGDGASGGGSDGFIRREMGGTTTTTMVVGGGRRSEMAVVREDGDDDGVTSHRPPSHTSNATTMDGKRGGNAVPRSCIASLPAGGGGGNGTSCIPRRYLSTTYRDGRRNEYYVEPKMNDDDNNGGGERRGMYDNVPSRPWDEGTISPMDLELDAVSAMRAVRCTMSSRYDDLLRSDDDFASSSSATASASSSTTVTILPKYLPPQFPQWDREIQRLLSSNGTLIFGFPPECCPTNENHRFMTKNDSVYNVLSEMEMNDCACRSPRNYPPLGGEGVGDGEGGSGDGGDGEGDEDGDGDGGDGGGPMATIVTAFYEISSKHPVKMYQKTALQLLSTSDPMVIFCEPNTTWIDFFVKHREHAPTVLVPLSSNDLRLKSRFPQDTVWKRQYDIDPEGSTHHKGVNTLLYVIWNEKLILLHSVAMLNPFNTTQFLWVDTGYFRNPAPHVFRRSAVRVNITEMGVNRDSVLLYQMIPYEYDRESVISGNRVLTGGNSFVGTYDGISNLYSAYYDTFWTMLITGQFVGSDQKVMYRTCHAYPHVCHIHRPRRYRQWLKLLGEVLPNLDGGERIGEPLKLHEFVMTPEEDDAVPIPPNGIVDMSPSDSIWG